MVVYNMALILLMVVQTWVLDLPMMTLVILGLMTRLLKEPKNHHHQGGKISTISVFLLPLFRYNPGEVGALLNEY